MDTQINDGTITLTLWKMCRMWYTKTIQNVVRKWAENKQNERVLGRANNQAPTVGLAQEQRHVHMTFERTSTKSKLNICSSSWFIKEYYIWR
jgi:hypothetical protein